MKQLLFLPKPLLPKYHQSELNELDGPKWTKIDQRRPKWTKLTKCYTNVIEHERSNQKILRFRFM